MRESAASQLRCPACRTSGRWALTATARDEREIREGTLGCEQCGTERAITGGIVDLLGDVPEFVTREAAGLKVMADAMRADGWTRERVLNLPDDPQGYWHHQATGMLQVLGSEPIARHLPPGRRILDVGANTCWASAKFAERGLEVVALDIAAHEMQGLATADWWFDAKDVFFERVLGVMFDLPLADASFDAVFCCEVLHHNHHENLEATLREIARVLKPGGVLIAINEPVRALLSPKLRPPRDVEQYEGHEHVYTRASYVRAARAAGLEVEVLGPWLVNAFNEQTWGIAPSTSSVRAARMALFHAVRRNRPLARSFLAWKTYVSGMSLYLLGTKPG